MHNHSIDDILLICSFLIFSDHSVNVQRHFSQGKREEYTKSWIWQYAKRHEREVAKKEAESQNGDDDSRFPLSDVDEDNAEEANGDDDSDEDDGE